MTNYRYTAIISTVVNSFGDATLDYAVNRFNYHKVLFFTTLVAGFGQLFIGMVKGTALTAEALPFVFIHAILVLMGYVCFIRSLKFIPVGLVGLAESGGLFLTFLIDAVFGYIHLTWCFFLLFLLFIVSIWMFSGECLKKESLCFKTIKVEGFLWVLGSVIFYVSTPYLVKSSSFRGADEITVNLGYYALAIPYFGFHYWCNNKNWAGENQVTTMHWWNSFFFLCAIIGSLEAVYYVFETFSFINDAPTIVMVIEQMRIFLLFILSVLFKTDRFTLKKVCALVLGMLAVSGLYLS